MKEFHDFTILVANTEANKATLEFNIDKGLISWAGFYYPAGCRGVVRARMFFQTHQILPRNVGSWCRGENGWWQGFMYFPVTASPLKIVCEGFNVNACYPHTIQVGLELQPWEMVPRWDKMLHFFRQFAVALGYPIREPEAEEFSLAGEKRPERLR